MSDPEQTHEPIEIADLTVFGLWWRALRRPSEAAALLSRSGRARSLGFAVAAFSAWAAARLTIRHAIQLLVIPQPPGGIAIDRLVLSAVLEMVLYAVGLVVFACVILLSALILRGVLNVARLGPGGLEEVLASLCVSAAPLPLLALTDWLMPLVVVWSGVLAAAAFRSRLGIDRLEASLLAAVGMICVFLTSWAAVTTYGLVMAALFA